MERATFAGGCFWGIEDVFRSVKGVAATRVGYAGGHHENPTYKDVCTGETGHAESVEIEFDSEAVSYQDLLAIFFTSHDPTQVNRQGPDIGHQYRSIIFFHDEKQKIHAQEAIRKLMESGKYSNPLATSLKPIDKFWEAEDYHQQYLDKLRELNNGRNGH